MAENTTPEPETTVEEQTEESPGRFKTFVKNNRRTIAASLTGAGVALGAVFVAKQKLGDDSSAPATVPGQVTSSTDTAMSEA